MPGLTKNLDGTTYDKRNRVKIPLSNKVYLIKQNDGLLTEEVYYNFDYAAYICEAMTGLRPTEIGVIYEIEPMNYIKVLELKLI